MLSSGLDGQMIAARDVGPAIVPAKEGDGFAASAPAKLTPVHWRASQADEVILECECSVCGVHDGTYGRVGHRHNGMRDAQSREQRADRRIAFAARVIEAAHKHDRTPLARLAHE
jgi:hypothetical protein